MNEPGEPEWGRISVGWPAVTVGYSHDLMLAVVERVRKELTLAVKLVPDTSQNRIPLVQMRKALRIILDSSVQPGHPRGWWAHRGVGLEVGNQGIQIQDFGVGDVGSTGHHLEAVATAGEKGVGDDFVAFGRVNRDAVELECAQCWGSRPTHISES